MNTNHFLWWPDHHHDDGLEVAGFFVMLVISQIWLHVRQESRKN
jgi:hypothetical protein